MVSHILRAMTIGQRIRAARKAVSLAQVDIAQACEVRELAVSHWERDLTMPRADAIVRIAERCNVDAGWLLTGQGDGPAVSGEAA